ncbi:MAG: glucose-1-phosphate cytidylyltransferase [Microgenomates group bacterium]
MKVVIFAGGYGTRISEESSIRPKPMVEIGGKPILWHIMKIYASYGLTDFIICCGYKGQVIKEYFLNYTAKQSDLTLDLGTNQTTIHRNGSEKWKVTLVDTGVDTMTGGRLKKVRPYLDNESFCLTYGDGLSDVNIMKTIELHKQSAAKATVTVVQPPGRFGIFNLKDGETIVSGFKEKPVGDGGGWINGGFFVVEPDVIDLIEDETVVWEQEPLTELSNSGNLAAYRHSGFWHPMDTLRDKNVLEEMWHSGNAKWKVW